MEYPSTAFKFYHKIDQVIFNRELLVTGNARSISKHAPSQSFPLFIRNNVECT